MAAENVNAPVQYVRHASLKRVGESPYRVWCPVCEEGILLVATVWVVPDTGRVCHLPTTGSVPMRSRYDRCTGCGQPFCYTDDIIHDEAFYEELHPDGEFIKAIDDAVLSLPKTRYDVLSED